MSIFPDAMEKKYSDLYEQHLGNVTKIEELKGKVTQVRAKLNSCCNDVLDIVTEIDALKKRSDHLHFTQMQVDIVRQLRSENERLKTTISDMTTACAIRDLEQIEIQTQPVWKTWRRSPFWRARWRKLAHNGSTLQSESSSPRRRPLQAGAASLKAIIRD
jgi:hypothetical protein